MPSVSIPAAIASIGTSLGIGATTAAGAGLAAGATTAAGVAGLGAATGVAGLGLGTAATAAAGLGLAGGAAAAGSTILGSLGTTALTTAAGVGLTKILNPTPKIPQVGQQPVMPVPNDGTVLNQQRQLAAQQSAQRLGRQSTILQSPGAGDYSAATF